MSLPKLSLIEVDLTLTGTRIAAWVQADARSAARLAAKAARSVDR
ncbi:hypothetical protein [Paraburkholderia azotifigens]|nr:hypothetical protein [Paraburkholderia azotifigens]